MQLTSQRLGTSEQQESQAAAEQPQAPWVLAAARSSGKVVVACEDLRKSLAIRRSQAVVEVAKASSPRMVSLTAGCRAGQLLMVSLRCPSLVRQVEQERLSVNHRDCQHSASVLS